MSNRVEISLKGSPLSLISLHCELHTPALNYMSVGLNTNNDTIIRQVITLASQIGLNLKKSIVSLGSTTLYSEDVSHFEKFSNLLLENRLISHEDRYLLRDLVLKVDKTFKERAFITESYTIAQSDILRTFSSPYIDTLVEDSQNYRDIIPLIAYAMHKFYDGPRGWERIVQKDSTRHVNVEQSVDCMRHLSAMMKGTMDLSSAFRQSGMGIPNLRQQQKILIEAIREAFDAKYGKVRSDKFEAFYVDLSIEKLMQCEFPGKNLCLTFRIDWDKGFPEHRPQKRVKILGSNIQRTLFLENDFGPTKIELQILKKHGLNRFPTSVEDLTAAQADESGSVITDLRLLRKLIDGELYPDMTPLEQLYCAIEDEECDEITRILTTSLDVNTPIGRDNPLRLASILSKFESVKTLLSLGAHINHEFEDGNSCLHSAAWNNSLTVVKLLLEHGASFSANKEGRTPLHQLFCFNHGEATPQEMIEMIQLLMQAESLSLSDLDSLTDHEGYNCFDILPSLKEEDSYCVQLKTN